MGAVVAAVLVAAAGAASGQEATPLWPDIGAVGAPATIDAPPLPDAGAIDPPAEQGKAAAAEPVAVQTTTGGSRLLRALAESTGPSGRRRDARAAERAAPALVARGSAAGGCPRALLRRLLAGAAGEADALAALAIETEVLTLCSERQRIVTALFESEARLKELRAPAETVPAVAAASIPVPAPAVPEMERETPAKPAPDTRAGDPAPSALRQALAADSGEKAKTKPSLGWFSILGSAGALRAGITDGTAAWFVQEGDALPGGGTVAGIAGRPPSVRTTGPEGGAGEPLPFRPRPGGQR